MKQMRIAQAVQAMGMTVALDEKADVPDDYSDLVSWSLGNDKKQIEEAINTALYKHSVKKSKRRHARELILTALNEIKVMQLLDVQKKGGSV